MDDIYFSDKKSRRENSKDSHSAKDRFTDDTHYDIEENPYLKKRTSENDIPIRKESFSVNHPEDRFDVYRDTIQQSRTPRGSRMAPETRTPSGTKISDTPSPARAPLERKPSQAPASPARKPAAQRPMNSQSRPPQQRSPQMPPVKKQKGSVKSKIVLAVFMLFVVFIAGIVGYGYFALGNINYDDSIVENEYISADKLARSPDVENILIIGSDEREEGSAEQDLVSGQRADTMILFSIDKKNKQIKLTSFLRDSYVYIPAYGYSDKLNAAYSLGGPQLTIDTLEYNFEVDIDSYLIINFDVFKQFINLLGGVPIEVSEYEADYMVNELKFIYIKPGVNVMNGNASLMYCRMRYLDNDLYRTQRQRKFIKAVVKEVAKTNIFSLLNIVRQVLPNIRTDITRNDLISLGAGAALKFLRYDIVQQQIPAEGTWWDEYVYGSGDVLVFNEEENCEILKEFIFEKHVEKESTEE